MAILFNVNNDKYIELHLFSIDDPEWIAYKIFGGKINITFIFRVIDNYNETEFLDNKFYIETSEYLLNDFLMQLKNEYLKVRMY